MIGPVTAGAAGTGAVVALGLMVIAGTVGVTGDGDTSSVATPVAPVGSVAPGRPCREPVETQGYKPGPGNLEPNHTGIDFACLGDRTLVAVLPGTVVVARDHDCGGGFGCTVVIETDTAKRRLFSRYGHAAEGSILVSIGELVPAGTPLAIEGSTGWSTGPHVHFEVDDSAPDTADCVNPAPFLDAGIVR